MTAADRLRALAEAATPGPWRVILPGDPSWSERRKYRCVDAALSPDVVLSLAGLVEAAGILSEAVADLALARGPVVSGPYALMDAETAHRKAVKALRAALAHVEELLP